MTVSLYCGNWTTRSLHIGVGECKKFAEVPDGGVLIAIQFIKESLPPHPPPPSPPTEEEDRDAVP